MTKKKVLILGGLGFIGKNMYISLAGDGHAVTLVADTINDQDSFLTDDVRRSLMQGSMLDKSFLENLVSGYDVIFSLAGRSGASDSILDPYSDLDRNLKGHLNILEACRKHNPKAILIFPSSRLVYGKPQHNPVSETHPLNPESIYAIHKNAVEQYYLLYQKLYGINSIIFRISNPYGPYQKFGSNHYGILNWFVHKALSGEEIEIYGDGSQKRDFLHIDDLVDILKRSMTNTTMFGQVYNVGYGKGISIKETVDIITKLIPKAKTIFKPWPEVDRKIETGDYISDISLLKKTAGWQPKINFEDGIRSTIKFYEGSRS